MINVNKRRFLPSRKIQSGFTLVEMLISTALLFLIMVMGTTIFSNIQSHFKLAEKESQMQQYARDAMQVMAREVRQAVDIQLVNPNVDGYSFEMFFTAPHVNADGSTSGFDLVRYWYGDDYRLPPGSGVKSLYAARKSNGNSSVVPGKPDPTDFEDNRRTLVREAAAQNPGTDSYFQQKITGSMITLSMTLRVNMYIKSPGSSFQYLADNNRKFDISTEVQYRNQS